MIALLIGAEGGGAGFEGWIQGGNMHISKVDIQVHETWKHETN
jgi:hypothetical protein